MTVTNVTKNSALLKWSGDKGDVFLDSLMIVESIPSPYYLTDLSSDAEYTVKVVNRGGESEEVTFTTLTDRTAIFDNGDLYDGGVIYA